MFSLVIDAGYLESEIAEKLYNKYMRWQVILIFLQTN